MKVPATVDLWGVDACGRNATFTGLSVPPVQVRGGPTAAPITLAIVTTATGSAPWHLPDGSAGGATRVVDAAGAALRGLALRTDAGEAA